MSSYIQAIALALLTSIVVLILKHTGKGIGELLSILVCVMIITMSLAYIRPVIDFIQTMNRLTSLDEEMIKTMMKAVGISITTEITSMICEDSGNQALGKSLQILATVVIAWIMIPMLTQLLKTMEGVLSAL